jgi:hypothetical protein
MLRRIEADEGPRALGLSVGAARSEPIAAVVEAEHETALLPHDHPRWVKDTVGISQRAREMVAKLRPIALGVLSFWDHRVRCIVVAERRLAVDASGCYRVDA